MIKKTEKYLLHPHKADACDVLGEVQCSHGAPGGKYRNKLVVALRATVEVAEINGKTNCKQQAAPETRTRDKKQNSKGGKGSRGGKGKGGTGRRDRQFRQFKQCECTYGRECEFKREASAGAAAAHGVYVGGGASVRHLPTDALGDSTNAG